MVEDLARIIYSEILMAETNVRKINSNITRYRLLQVIQAGVLVVDVIAGGIALQKELFVPAAGAALVGVALIGLEVYTQHKIGELKASRKKNQEYIDKAN